MVYRKITARLKLSLMYLPQQAGNMAQRFLGTEKRLGRLVFPLAAWNNDCRVLLHKGSQWLWDADLNKELN